MKYGVLIKACLILLFSVNGRAATIIPADLVPPYTISSSHSYYGEGGSAQAAAEMWARQSRAYWNRPDCQLLVESVGEGIISGDKVRVGRACFAETAGCGGCDGIWINLVCPNGFNLNGAGECISEEPDPLKEEDECAGNPIGIGSGVKIQRENDFNFFGTKRSFNFNRTYRFDDAVRPLGIFGVHWYSLLDSRLLFSQIGTSEFAIVYLSDGRGVRFKKVSSQWVTATHEKGNPVLEYDSINSIWNYGSNGVTLTFDEEGSLVHYKESDQSLNFNRQITFIEVTDANDVIFRIELNSYGLADKIELGSNIYRYEYLNGKLSRITNADGTSRTYNYEDPRYDGALTSILDNQNREFASWKYDSSGRAYESSHYNGFEKVSLNYVDSNTVEVTNALDKISRYTFEVISNAKKVVSVEGQPSTNCAAANQYKSYYPNATLQTQTDWEGNVTYFERDTLGRTIKKTEALKWPGTPQYGLNVDASTLQTTANTKITQTCWHATHNKPERTIEPGRVTIYDYFDNGQIKNKRVEKRTVANEQCLH